MNHLAIKTIQDSEFFKGLPPDACRKLSTLCRRLEVKKKETLFRENTKGDCIYLMTHGAIQLTKTTMVGNEIVIRTIKPGGVFAEVILFEEDRYPVTATASTPCTVWAFKRIDILNLLDGKTFRNDFIRSLMRKQRYLAERVRYLTSYDVEQRFFMFLKEQYGDKTQIKIEMSKKDIAAAIGATPETFSRLINRLQKDKVIQWTSKTIKLHAFTHQ